LTLTPATEALLRERYSEKAMREWLTSVRADRAARQMQAVLISMVESMKPAALLFARLLPVHRPRPDPLPLSPLTRRLLAEKYPIEAT
jgi:hypothetical protein